jgi:hypothetical protein
MASHRRFAVLEIEEGSVSLTIGAGTRRAFAIESCARQPRPDDDELPAALGALLAATDAPVRDVHVLLGDRRFLHYKAELPRMDAIDLRAFVRRESVRIGSLADDVALLADCRHEQRLRGGHHRFSVIALPAQVWATIAPALARNGLEAMTLTSVEDSMARVLPAGVETAAVLDISGGRARLVHADHGIVTQVRRFLLPGTKATGDEPDPMLVAHLAMEVPRTLDYLAEIGERRPSLLLLSHRIPIGSDELPMIAAEIETCRQFAAPFEIPYDQPQPSLATVGALQRLLQGAPRSLLGGISAQGPRSRAPLVAVVLTVAVGAAASVEALRLQAETALIDQSTAATARDLAALQADEQRLLESIGPGAPASDAELDAVLRRRRPVSLLLASACNAAPATIRFESLAVTAEDRIELRGHTVAGGRMAGLRAIADLTERLRTLPCVGQCAEDVLDLADADELAFTVQLGWRTP